MTAWFDRVKACVEWDRADQARVAEVRGWLDSDGTEVVKALGKQLAQLNGIQPLMTNVRFVERLHNVLREWLIGLLDGTYDGEYIKERSAFGQKLIEVDLSFEDVILLEGLARRKFFELAQERLGEDPEAFSATMHTVDKVINLDLALIYSGYLQVRDAEMERALLDRFLTITGFSRTLYENLAETRGWSQAEQ